VKKENTTIDNTNREKSKSPNCEHLAFQGSMPEFDSPGCEAKFRKALRNVPSKTYIKNDGAKLTMFVRPFNLLEFGASINHHGLEQCEASKNILRYLDKNKEEILKFEHLTKN
jgi:hypothetical protein